MATAVTEAVTITVGTTPVLLTFSNLKYGVRLVALPSNSKFMGFGSGAAGAVSVDNSTGVVTNGAPIPQAASGANLDSIPREFIPAQLFLPGAVYANGLYVVGSAAGQNVVVTPA